MVSDHLLGVIQLLFELRSKAILWTSNILQLQLFLTVDIERLWYEIFKFSSTRWCTYLGIIKFI